MSIFYTDLIEITPVAYDSETNEKVESASVETAGYWEEDSGIAYNDGLPVGPKSMVFFPSTVSIKKGDLVRLLKKGSVDVSSDPEYTEKRIVKKAILESSLGFSHYEVTM